MNHGEFVDLINDRYTGVLALLRQRVVSIDHGGAERLYKGFESRFLVPGQCTGGWTELAETAKLLMERAQRFANNTMEPVLRAVYKITLMGASLDRAERSDDDIREDVHRFLAEAWSEAMLSWAAQVVSFNDRMKARSGEDEQLALKAKLAQLARADLITAEAMMYFTGWGLVKPVKPRRSEPKRDGDRQVVPIKQLAVVAATH